MTVGEKRSIRINSLAIILILFANICFYTEELVRVYTLMSGAGILIAFAYNIRNISKKVSINNLILWFILVYGMYLFNGFMRLQRGTFNGDVLVFRFVECIAFYICISEIFKIDFRKIGSPFVITGLVSVGILLLKEGAAILAGGTRIGDSLSGNVNTVGFNLGIISMVLIWLYNIEKKKAQLVLFIIFAVFILLTGSKKALIIIVFDLFLVLIYQKKKASIWLILPVIFAIGIYLIFNVPYFYDIIGVRIESMFMTWIYGSSAANYSYSTDMRDVLIKEGFDFFSEKPIFGGGYNYFYLRTSTSYDYSHCNYIELLTSFGLVGTLLYYLKYFSNLKFLYLNYRHGHNKAENTDLSRLAVVLLIQSLILDWSAVTFSAQAVWYLPIIIASVSVNRIKSNNMLLAEEKHNEQAKYIKKTLDSGQASGDCGSIQ